jgi:hypothetical protein
MKKILYNITGIFLAVLLFAGAACAEEISFQASLDRNVLYLGQSVQLSLSFQGSSKIQSLELPELEGFQSRYVGPSTRMSIVNGRMSSSITHVYRLVPLKTGKFTLGPFSIHHKGDTYTSNALNVEVLDHASGSRGSDKPQEQKQVHLSDRVFVKMVAEKRAPYINESVPLTIKLYVSGVSVQDIQYPEYYHEGFSNGRFDKPRQYKQAIGDILYDVVEFNTDIFATKDGTFTLGPAKIKANIVTRKRRQSSSRRDDFFGRDPFGSFFGGYESQQVELKSEEVSMNVLPLPAEGRPRSFKGAIGNFKFDLEVSPSEVNAGDPVTLKIIISGEGNFNTVTGVLLEKHDGFKTYEPQATQEGNRKIFEQVLIPTSDAVKEIPAVSFSFFDTEKGRYKTIARGGMPLIVHKPQKNEQITIMESPVTAVRPLGKEKFGRDIIYIKELPGEFREKGRYLYKSVLFIFLHILPALAFVSAWIMKKRKEKLSTDPGYARRLLAPKNAKKGLQEAEHFLRQNSPAEFYDALFRTVREYIGNRFHVPAGGITSDVAVEVLKEKGVDQDLLTRLKNVISECDMARYAPSELDSSRMQNALREVKEIIDYLERYKG